MTTIRSYDSEGRFVFRLPTAEERAQLDKIGPINPGRFFKTSIVEGEPHMALIVHLIVGILALGYGVLSNLAIWPHEFSYLGQVILTGMKGAALGSLLVGAALRWGPQGRTVKKRIQEKTATKTDERLRLLGQLAFAYGAYFFVGVTFFEYFPKLSERTPTSIPLRVTRYLAKAADVEKLWNPIERWATAPAEGAQLLRPTAFLKP